MNTILKKLDYLFILRPILFFPVWTLALGGFYSAERFSDTANINSIPFLFFSFLLFTFTSGAVYLINNIEDAEGDKINKKVLLIQEGYFTKQEASRYLNILLVGLSMLSLFVTFKIFVWMLLWYLVTGYLYSAKPFKLKDTAYGAIAINIISGFMAFGFGWQLQTGSMQLVSIWYALPYVFAWVSVSLLTTIPDKEGDIKEDKETLTVKHGVEKTQDIAYLLLGLALFTSAMTWDWVIGVASALSLPAYREMFNTRTVSATLKAIRHGIGLLSFLLALVYPLYFMLVVFIYTLSKWYYKKRFNLNYPTLKTDES